MGKLSEMVMTRSTPAPRSRTTASKKAAIGLPSGKVVARAAKNPTPDAGANRIAATSDADVYWRSVQAVEIAGLMALDRSLAFHRLQEARQELHRARTEFAELSVRERAGLVALCQVNLARAEQWVARTSGTETTIACHPPLPQATRPQASSERE
jgi:hypothetical protein